MSATAQSLIVFLCVAGCALIGFKVRRFLPEHHLSSDSLLAVSLTTGLAATLASLVLGLMVSSTHSSFSKLNETRWLFAEQNRSSIPPIFFIALVAWLCFIFFGFGLITDNNSTVLCSLLGGALLACSAIFVILEMDSPLDGLVSVSIAPMDSASAILGRAP